MEDPICSLRALIRDSSTSKLDQYPDILVAYQKLLAEADELIQRFDQKASPQAQVSGRSRSDVPDEYNSFDDNTLPRGTHAEHTGLQTVTTSKHFRAVAEQSGLDPAQPKIDYRMEDGIPVLLPKDKFQCRDTPSLLARAAELGAAYTGVFKYVLPEDVDFEIESVRVSSVTTFSSQTRKNGAYKITYHKKNDGMVVKRGQFLEMSARDLAAALEQAISDPDRLGQMRYSTDCPARTPQERRQHGVPVESPLSSLKGNQLSLTRYGISGIHWPDAYAANECGGLFIIHTEDGHLHSFNALHFGLRSITVVIPQHAPLIDRLFKRWPCAQRARHESTYIPRAILDKLGVSYNVLLQRPREVVGFMPYAYHQGGSLSSASAEAVNYAAIGWNVAGYSECRRGRDACPGYPIPNAYLTFRAPGEAQLEQEFDPFAGDETCEVINAKADIGASGQRGQGGDVGISLEDAATRQRTRKPARVVEADVGHPAPQDGPNQLTRPTRQLRAHKAQLDVLQSVPETVSGKGMSSISQRCANTSAPREATKAGKSKSARLDQELTQIEAQIKSIDKHCKIPIYSTLEPPSYVIMKLVAAIWSRPAVKQFVDLVRSRRDSEFTTEGFDPSSNILYRIGSRVRSIQKSERRSTFERFRIRLDQWQLAEYLEIARKGRHRNDPAVINAICKPLGWKKTTLDYHRMRGQGWRRLCGHYDGLLGFVLFGSNAFGISPDSYLDLQESELDTFHALLDSDYTKALCSVGRAFQASLNPLAWDVEFRWESLDDDISQMSEEKLLTCLQPCQASQEDLYDGSDPAWTRPQGWNTQWKWPCDPTSIPDQLAQKCELCHAISCECIRDCFINVDRPKPRIKYYGKKGRGIQAVARTPGEVAYKEGDMIGILVGKVVPVGADKDEWSMEVRRTDLPRSLGESVCSIHYHYRDFGNTFRLMNSHCDAPAVVRPTRISGKCRLVVKAVRDIRDREEIAIYYGRQYFAKKGMKCLCEVCGD